MARRAAQRAHPTAEIPVSTPVESGVDAKKFLQIAIFFASRIIVSGQRALL
jgi:hypothetical protein